MTTIYSYCEATSAYVWHIRKLGPAGLRPTGGVDTPSLCGHMRPPYGWDIPKPLPNPNHEFPSRCVTCFEMFKPKHS